MTDRPGRLPNLVIAGVSKAGTTSLFNYLGQHPDIGTSDVKELRYFSALRQGQELGPLDGYTVHFASCVGHRFALEATPGYFYGGRELAEALDRTCPDVHVIVSLRSPAERCWSWFRFVQSRVRIPREMSFEEYLDRCEELHRAGVDDRVENQPFWGLGGGCYSRWLPSWTDQFGDRLRVLFFEDLVTDPRQVLASTVRWLGLDLAPLDSFTLSVDNKTEPYRSEALQRAAVAVNRGSERFFRRHAHLKRALRSAYYAVNKAPADTTLPPASRLRLDSFYRPHTDRLHGQLAALGLRVPERWSASPHTLPSAG